MSIGTIFACIFIGLMEAIESMSLFLMGVLIVALIYHNHIHISIT